MIVLIVIVSLSDGREQAEGGDWEGPMEEMELAGRLGSSSYSSTEPHPSGTEAADSSTEFVACSQSMLSRTTCGHGEDPEFLFHVRSCYLSN